MFHILFYLIMGWMIVFKWNEASRVLAPGFTQWVIAGGAFYTLGVVIYALRKIPFHHAIWHLFVLGGSTSFLIGVYKYI